MLGEREVDLQPGNVIAGKYEIVRQVQAGAMGVVFACRHLDFDGHLVAVKVLFPDVARDHTACARLQQEICSSYLVTHPNIVRTYEYLRDKDLIGYSMEYVDGGDLAERLERGERFSVAATVHILAQICAGVQAMHDARIVHRDLKPENILLTMDGTVKIADFGIARVSNERRLTESGGLVGTIAYMSPEYMLRADADWRSDIYAIGVLGFEMLTGEPPFDGKSAIECMRNRIKKDAPAVSQFVTCPPQLDTIIARALARDPAQRFQSAGEMQQALQKVPCSENVEEVRIPLRSVNMWSGKQRPPRDYERDTAEYRYEEVIEIASLYGDEPRQAAAKAVVETMVKECTPIKPRRASFWPRLFSGRRGKSPQPAALSV